MVKNAAPISEKDFWRITAELAGVVVEKKFIRKHYDFDRGGPVHAYVKRVKDRKYEGTTFELLLSYSRQYNIWKSFLFDVFGNTDIPYKGDDGRSDLWDAAPLLGPKAIVEFLEIPRNNNYLKFEQKWRGILSKELCDTVFFGENYIQIALNIALESFLTGDTRMAKVNNIEKQRKKDAIFSWEKWREEVQECF